MPATIRHFLSVADLSPAELDFLLADAERLRLQPRGDRLDGLIVAFVTEKESLRTKLAFDVATRHQRGFPLFFGPNEVKIGAREPAKDVARVLGRQVALIAARVYAHATVEELAAYAGVPVVNALSDREHPCQALADVLTLRQHLGDVRGKRIGFIGDGNNVATSLMLATATLGMDFAIACPDGYAPPERETRIAQQRADLSGGRVSIVREPEEAARGAHALYTDVWVSMGQENDAEEREAAFAGYQITGQLVRAAQPGAIVLHDLPAHRGEEVTDEVMDLPNAQAIWDQAENRMHAQKALILWLLGR
jgi:ornithine carbamoyltransferase